MSCVRACTYMYLPVYICVCDKQVVSRQNGELNVTSSTVRSLLLYNFDSALIELIYFTNKFSSDKKTRKILKIS